MIEGLVESIETQRAAHYKSEQAIYPQYHPRASGIGDCPLEIVHSINNWQLKPAPEIPLCQRFKRGRQVESMVTQELMAMGFDVHSQQIPFQIKEQIDGKEIIICTGHMDGRIAWEGQQPVYEVKSLVPHVWDRIECITDFFTMGSFWTRYPRQMLMYMRSCGERYGILILDDLAGHWKVIPVSYNAMIGEADLAYAICKRAAVAIHSGDGLAYCDNAETCNDCWAQQAGVCFPPILHEAEVKMIDNLKLAADIERMRSLEDAGKEYNRLKDRSDKKFKAIGAGTYLVGDQTATVTERVVRIKEKPAVSAGSKTQMSVRYGGAERAENEHENTEGM